MSWPDSITTHKHEVGTEIALGDTVFLDGLRCGTVTGITTYLEGSTEYQLDYVWSWYPSRRVMKVQVLL